MEGSVSGSLQIMTDAYLIPVREAKNTRIHNIDSYYSYNYIPTIKEKSKAESG